MAEGILRARFLERGIDVDVMSVGTLGWSQRAATPHAVAVMAEMGIDISQHRSRRIEPEHLDVDLVLAMTRDHAGAVIARRDGARSNVFLPSELVRLLREVPVGGAEHPTERIHALGAARQGPTIGRPAEEVPDPAGEPLDVYRATARRLDRDLTGLVVALTA